MTRLNGWQFPHPDFQAPLQSYQNMASGYLSTSMVILSFMSGYLTCLSISCFLCQTLPQHLQIRISIAITQTFQQNIVVKRMQMVIQIPVKCLVIQQDGKSTTKDKIAYQHVI